jgi:hypothetical protein
MIAAHKPKKEIEEIFFASTETILPYNDVMPGKCDEWILVDPVNEMYQSK